MYHTVILVGRLGRDPEMRYTPSGQAVTSFSVATDYQTKSPDGNWEKKTIWVRVTVWGKQAETASQYLKKGREVLIEGRLNPDPSTGGPRIWTRQDGTAGASYEVTANTVRFIGGRGDGEGGYPGSNFDAPQSGDTEGDIPF
jgi:single-strand DNA-binding protein